MITKQDYWDMRAQTYDQIMKTTFRGIHRDTVDHISRYLKPTDRVLDFACGTGLISTDIAHRVASVQAIDLSPEMVVRAKANVQAYGVQNVQVSGMDLFDPALEPGSFDVVIAGNVLCYVDNWAQVMQRIQELLPPDGVFLSATDCLGQESSRVGAKKFYQRCIGQMPYVKFFRQTGLEKKIRGSGFHLLETAVLGRHPTNVFVAARKEIG